MPRPSVSLSPGQTAGGREERKGWSWVGYLLSFFAVLFRNLKRHAKNVKALLQANIVYLSPTHSPPLFLSLSNTPSLSPSVYLVSFTVSLSLHTIVMFGNLKTQQEFDRLQHPCNRYISFIFYSLLSTKFVCTTYGYTKHIISIDIQHEYVT